MHRTRTTPYRGLEQCYYMTSLCPIFHQHPTQTSKGLSAWLLLQAPVTVAFLFGSGFQSSSFLMPVVPQKMRRWSESIFGCLDSEWPHVIASFSKEMVKLILYIEQNSLQRHEMGILEERQQAQVRTRKILASCKENICTVELEQAAWRLHPWRCSKPAGQGCGQSALAAPALQQRLGSWRPLLAPMKLQMITAQPNHLSDSQSFQLTLLAAATKSSWNIFFFYVCFVCLLVFITRNTIP